MFRFQIIEIEKRKTGNIVQCKLAFYSCETTKNVIKRGSFHEVRPLASLKFNNSSEGP